MQHLLLTPAQAPPAETSILVGPNALGALPITLQGAPLVLAVADRAVAGTAFGDAVSGHLARIGTRVELFAIEGSERAKSLAAATALWQAWLAAGAGRDAVAVAVGGGVVSDVTGFAAACFMRGIAWVAVPTTVIAMADAAIGGKTAINLPEGKNLVGAVHPPRAVLIDVEALASLPDEPYRDGWAEVVKAAVIADAPLLDELAEAAPRLTARETQPVEACLARAVRVKVQVVAEDLHEGSRREILNFGHTVGHALEHAAGGALSHGRAVAAGLVAEAVLAVGLGRLPADAPRRIAATCDALGVPWRAPEVDREAFAEALGNDKKRRAGRLRVALPDGLGTRSATPGVEVETERLMEALETARALLV